MPGNLYTRDEIWWARFKVRGVEYRRSLRTRVRSLAEKRLVALRRQVEDEAVFGIHGPVGWPAAVVAWNVGLERRVGEATLRRYVTSLAMCRAHLDPLSVQQIDARAIRDLVKARQRQGVTNASIRRDLTAISSVLDFAIEEGWITDNAARGYSRRGIPERRDPIRLPDEASIAAIIGPRRTRFGDLIAFARVTGMRQEEIVGLTHGAVDRRGGLAMIVGKGNRPRAVSLTAEALAIIDRQPRFLKCEWVFWHEAEDAEGRPTAQRYTNVSSNFGDYAKRAAKRAARAAAADGVAQRGAQFLRFRFHDLRHLFAVEYLREGRGSIYDLQRQLGHSSVKTTEIYLDYVTPDQARDAMYGVAQSGSHKLRSGTE